MGSLDYRCLLIGALIGAGALYLYQKKNASG